MHDFGISRAPVRSINGIADTDYPDNRTAVDTGRSFGEGTVISAADRSRRQFTETESVDGHLQVEIRQGGPEIIRAVAEEWRALCDSGRREMAFMRPELMLATIDIYAKAGPIVLLTARREGRLVAVVALTEVSAGIGPLRYRWLQSAGGHHAPRFDVLYSDTDPDEIAKAFWHLLKEHYGRRIMQFVVTPTNGVLGRIGALAALEGQEARSHDHDASPYIVSPEGDISRDELIGVQKKSLRKSLRRGIRRLEDRGTLRFIIYAPGTARKERASWYEQFCEIEHGGWKGAGGTSIRSDVNAWEFYRTIIEDDRLPVYCLALMLDDEMIAGHLAILSGPTLFGLKIAINEAYRECSPGHLFQLFEILEMQALGAREFDLSGRSDSYKLSWTSSVRPFQSILIFPKGLKGSMLRLLVYEVALRGKEELKNRASARKVVRLLRRARALRARVNR